MKNKPIRKNILKFLAIAAVLAIVAVYWYLLPVPQYIATTLCSQEGRQVQVIIDVTWHRSLFSPTKVEGTVTVDGVTYNSIGNVVYGDGSFFSKLKAKFRSDRYPYMFSRGGPWAQDRDMLDLYYTGEDLDQEDSRGIYCYIFPHGQKASYYYGPAKNIDEVNTILAKRMGN